MKAILRPQQTVPKQPGQRLQPGNAEELQLKDASTGTAAPGLGFQLSLIPPISPAAGVVQTKPAVILPGDEYEQEADHVAEQVMRMPEPQPQPACACGGACPECKTKHLRQESLQTKRIRDRDTAPAAAPPIIDQGIQSPGHSLDSDTRAFMEPRFGHDFSQVRIHTDPLAQHSAATLDALAYTLGSNIVFAAGQYQPRSTPGKRLLAHELVHVIQQTAGGTGKTGPIIQFQRGGRQGGAACPQSRVYPLPAGNVVNCSIDPVTSPVRGDNRLRLFPNQQARIIATYPRGMVVRSWNILGGIGQNVRLVSPHRTGLRFEYLIEGVRPGRTAVSLPVGRNASMRGTTTCSELIDIEVLNEPVFEFRRERRGGRARTRLNLDCRPPGTGDSVLIAYLVRPAGLRGRISDHAWNIREGSDKLTLRPRNGNPDERYVHPTSASAAEDDINIVYQATINCQRFEASHEMTVLRPNLRRVEFSSGLCPREITGLMTGVVHGYEYYAIYEVKDQFGAPIEGILVDETISVCADSRPARLRGSDEEGDNRTDSEGRVCDSLQYYFSPRPLPRGVYTNPRADIDRNLCIIKDQDLNVGRCGPLIRNILVFTPAGVMIRDGDCTAGASCD